jgi:hypothetical protein
MAKQTFELVSPFLSIYTPSKTWNMDNNLLLGQTINHLVPGEFLEIDSSYGVARGAVGKGVKPAFAFFSEPGRGDIVTGGKIPILQFGPYEADTTVFLRDANGEAVGLAVGDAVSITDVQDPANPTAGIAAGNLTHRGISTAEAGAFVIGYVSRRTGSGSNMKIRIMCGIGNNA